MTPESMIRERFGKIRIRPINTPLSRRHALFGSRSAVVLVGVLLTVSAVSKPVAAELRPSECVIIYNSRSPRSKAVAQYYAQKRSIPNDHLLGVPLPIKDTLPRTTYEASVRPMIRAFLNHPVWGRSIRCVVTCYEVPIRIGRRLPDEGQRSRAAVLRAQLVEALDHTEQLIDRAVGRRSRPQGRRPAGNSNAKAKSKRKINGKHIDKLYARYVRAQTGLARNWRGLRREDLLNARGRMLQFIQLAVGESGLLEHLTAGRNALNDEAKRRMETMRQHCEELQHQIRPGIAPDSDPETFNAVVPLIGERDGMFGVVKALLDREQSVLGLRTTAAFDSELALVLWDDYELDKWQTNEIYHNLAPTTTGPSEPPPQRTLMVARLDGPTPGIVRRMIDDAMDTERRGLRGTFYFDTRGLSKGEPFFDFDQNIRELAQLVRTQTSIPVVVDTNAEVFQPGTCPDAALYCGWYSLRNYVDAFDFVPGAVAIHIASFELTSLRAPEKRYWCKELLKDGAAATYGATDEPFLQAFPLPTDFFTMLLTGRFTLVETFSATRPFASWRLSLLGDPLYNPFKQNPQLSWDEGVDP